MLYEMTQYLVSDVSANLAGHQVGEALEEGMGDTMEEDTEEVMEEGEGITTAGA